MAEGREILPNYETADGAEELTKILQQKLEQSQHDPVSEYYILFKLSNQNQKDQDAQQVMIKADISQSPFLFWYNDLRGGRSLPANHPMLNVIARFIWENSAKQLHNNNESLFEEWRKDNLLSKHVIAARGRGSVNDADRFGSQYVERPVDMRPVIDAEQARHQLSANHRKAEIDQPAQTEPAPANRTASKWFSLFRRPSSNKAEKTPAAKSGSDHTPQKGGG